MTQDERMETQELREWAQNLSENDEPGSVWPNAEALLSFMRRNWDFPGTLEDAERIMEYQTDADAINS